MRRRHIGRVCLAGICLASILVLLALAVSGCGEGAPATTASVDTPVSARDDRTLWLGTTSTGSGSVDLYCSVTFTASQPRDPVAVSLFNGAGEFIDSREGMPYEFKGLQPGKYRLGVFGVSTGYISQWYGGLPAQGHDVSESQVLDLQPGRNVAEFALQPGLSIRGEVSWTQGTRVSGDILVYALQRRDTGRNAWVGGGATVAGGPDSLLAGVGYQFLIVGLLPGRYRIGVSFDPDFTPPQFWDGGGSFEHAPVIDLTSRDVAGVHVKLGALPATTTTTMGATTSSQ